MLADIVIFSNDIFHDPPQSLKDSAVTVTIFDGKSFISGRRTPRLIELEN
jgi:predicted amidohydrolase YtcJ